MVIDRAVDFNEFKGRLEDLLQDVALTHQPIRVLLDGGVMVEVRPREPAQTVGTGGPMEVATGGTERTVPSASPGSIEEEIETIARSTPQSEWAALPKDLSDNLDHYIYGAPRRA